MVVGLGEIGGAVLTSLGEKIDTDLALNQTYKLSGVDIDLEKLTEFSVLGYKTYDFKDMPEADIYLICVWTYDQIVQVIAKINNLYPDERDHLPLIIIESTVPPKNIVSLLDYIEYSGLKVAFCPHRLVPYDKTKWVFNISRVLGCDDKKDLAEAVAFYTDFMDKPQYIATTDSKTAIMSKNIENAYRFMEIVIAQEFGGSCDGEMFNWEAVRSAVNTKWNMDLKEAKDGVRGKCLPKEMKAIAEFFKDSPLYRMMLMLNNEYIERINNG